MRMRFQQDHGYLHAVQVQEGDEKKVCSAFSLVHIFISVNLVYLAHAEF